MVDGGPAERVLRELDERATAEERVVAEAVARGGTAELSGLMLAAGRETGALLALLVEIQGSRRILELGTVWGA